MGIEFGWGKLTIYDCCRTDASIYPLGAEDAALRLEVADLRNRLTEKLGGGL